ncbi:endo-1,4-beta-xylanase [uncultured Bacteroides sp.]|uniref:endo-1,4-beta-xylanase n=1 Tax=uncultured Bacteroides sp. TaxID=162156 RepID=UPI002AAA679B|nr:endo-1,4-beta-xylanase [uncultured Bacteroides sp.]
MRCSTNLLMSVIASSLLISCADNNVLDYSTEKPAKLVEYEYLNSYDALKTYVDRDANPNFKLGSGVGVSDFLKGELVHSLACTNYDELTAGNAMKYGSVVKNNGAMSFLQVAKFVAAAKEAGVSIYGHTLCWHAQQNVTYLNSLVSSLNNCLHLNTPEARTNIWDWQINYKLPKPMKVGVKYTLQMRVKASSAIQIGFWPFTDGGATQYESSIPASIKWSDVSVSFTAKTALEKLQFVFGTFKGDLYFDDISLTAEGSTENLVKNGAFDSNNSAGWAKPSWHPYTFNVEGSPDASGSAPLTPEEKADTLTWAMGQWIKGMMEACDGYVKAWDVVNEPMSDGQPSELKSDPTHEDASNFYWQDYLGKDYARVAIKLARQYGGDDLKLFINDYNLEAAYNANAKCVGLINMIKYWESDGVTKIDGIGTQMHVTYSLNPVTQQKNEEAVVNMYTLLAATGKLIKVSELDMGLADENGETILTTSVTEEQHKAMAEYYKFIIKKYFEIIPAAQRYGITQWAATDSPTDSGWRKGQPIGLWDLNYNRKHTYAGFADGLAGK